VTARLLRRSWIAFACAAWVASVTPAFAQQVELGALAGTWVRDQRERDDAARDAAIAAATESFSFSLRGLARTIMRRRMVPPESYVMEAGADAPSIRNGTTGDTVPVNGRPHVFGKDHEVTSRIAAPGEIEQEWKNGDTHGTTRFRLAADGDHIVVAQRLNDPHFDAPIEYSTTYRRAP
jgi:hypothetical protein